MAEKKRRRRWSGKVKTVSTRPPKDLFTKDAATIARTMARRSVSPKGPGSGVRMIQFFINRAGRSLSATRRRELERAKRLLQERSTSRGRKPTAAKRRRRTDHRPSSEVLTLGSR
jgi:tRNA(adenine34) deaminase